MSFAAVFFCRYLLSCVIVGEKIPSCRLVILVCFFTQKTAYEIRISDWSSDVCASDLALRPVPCLQHGDRRPSRPRSATASASRSAGTSPRPHAWPARSGRAGSVRPAAETRPPHRPARSPPASTWSMPQSLVQPPLFVEDAGAPQLHRRLGRTIEDADRFALETLLVELVDQCRAGVVRTDRKVGDRGRQQVEAALQPGGRLLAAGEIGRAHV